MRRVNTQAPDVLQAVRSVRDFVADTSLPVDVAPDARAIVNQLDDYVLPRLANLDAPLLAVIGGSTAALAIGLAGTQGALADPGLRQPEDGSDAGPAALRRGAGEAHLRGAALYHGDQPRLRGPSLPAGTGGRALRGVGQGGAVAIEKLN